MYDLPACKSHLKFICSFENTGLPNYDAANKPVLVKVSRPKTGSANTRTPGLRNVTYRKPCNYWNTA